MSAAHVWPHAVRAVQVDTHTCLLHFVKKPGGITKCVHKYTLSYIQIFPYVESFYSGCSVSVSSFLPWVSFHLFPSWSGQKIRWKSLFIFLFILCGRRNEKGETDYRPGFFFISFCQRLRKTCSQAGKPRTSSMISLFWHSLISSIQTYRQKDRRKTRFIYFLSSPPPNFCLKWSAVLIF